MGDKKDWGRNEFKVEHDMRKASWSALEIKKNEHFRGEKKGRRYKNHINKTTGEFGINFSIHLDLILYSKQTCASGRLVHMLWVTANGIT